MTRLAKQAKEDILGEIGFDVDESEILRIKSDPMIELSELIDRRGWTQAQAARIMEVT